MILSEDLHRVAGVEQGFLVLLQIPVICQGEGLEHGQHRDQGTGDPAGLSPDQLQHVGVRLLRHDTAAGAEVLGEAQEAEFRRGPEDEFLCEAAQVRHDEGAARDGLHHEVPVAHGVDTVLADRGKPQALGKVRAVYRIRRAGQGAAAQGEASILFTASSSRP